MEIESRNACPKSGACRSSLRNTRKPRCARWVKGTRGAAAAWSAINRPYPLIPQTCTAVTVRGRRNADSFDAFPLCLPTSARSEFVRSFRVSPLEPSSIGEILYSVQNIELFFFFFSKKTYYAQLFKNHEDYPF